MILKFNKKGQTGTFICIIAVFLILYFFWIRPLQDERNTYKSESEYYKFKFDGTKNKYEIRVQSLLNENKQLKSNLTILQVNVLKYKSDTTIINSKVQVPFTSFVIKIYWLGLIFSLLLFIKFSLLKIEFNIKLEDIKSTWKSLLIWIIIILNIVLMILSAYALIKDLFFT